MKALLAKSVWIVCAVVLLITTVAVAPASAFGGVGYNGEVKETEVSVYFGVQDGGDTFVDSIIANLGSWIGGLIIAVIAALAAAWFGFRQWRLQHFSDKWYHLMEFLNEHSGYMDTIKNGNYDTAYPTAEEKWKYESIARMCVAYVDDAFYLGIYNNKSNDDWYKGTVPLLVGKHYQWFLDNDDSYSDKFKLFVEGRLKSVDASRIARKTNP